MKSSLSFCNRTVLFKNVRRFAPLWALYLAGMLLIGPVMLCRVYFGEIVAGRVAAASRYMNALVEVGWYISFLYALLTASMCFKYLHNVRSAYMLHALPVNRSTYYGTNLISGLLFALAPMTLSVLLCLGLLLTFGVTNAFALAFGTLLNWTLQYLFFYGVAVFCMLLTGRNIIGVLTYFAVNVIGFILPALVCATVDPLFFGFTCSGEDFVVLSPIFQEFRSLRDAPGSLDLLTWIYAAVGVLLLVLGWLHYRKRQIERVGDAMIYRWASIVFQVLFTALCTLGLGWMLWLIVTGFDTGSVYRLYLPFLACLSVGCFVGWFAARMMLKRTVRVFQKSGWLGCGVAVAVVWVCLLGVRFDVFGLQKYVPAQSSVSAVEVCTGGENTRITLSEPAQIAQAIELHNELLKDRPHWEQDSYDVFWDKVEIRYRLRSGLTVTRGYRVYRDNFDSATNADLLVQKLYSDPAVAAKYYREQLEQLRKTTKSAWITFWTEADGRSGLPLKVSLDELYAAVLSDAEAGRLPVGNYTLHISGLMPSVEPNEYELCFSAEAYAPDYWYYSSPDFTTIYLTPTATDTLRCFGIR